MPMSADEALEIIRDHVYNCGYDHLGLPLVNELPLPAVEAIREAFAIAARAREELERLEALDLNHLSQQRQRDRDQDVAWLKRILGEEGST